MRITSNVRPTAEQVPFTPTPNITAENVQEAIIEVLSKIERSEGDLILLSPDGIMYLVGVSDNGSLTTEVIPND